MSSVGLSGLSNISTDALQTRYQKALKQIDKLIEINRQLKESANQKDSQISELRAQIANLQQKVHELDEENNILDSKYMELDQHCNELENYCKELMQNMQENHTDGKDLEEKLREREKKYNQQLQNEAMKYNELAREAEIIHQVYQESLTTIQAHEEKTKTLEQLSIQLQQKVKKLEQENQRLSQILKGNSNQQLRKRLQQANITIQKLAKECSELKNKQIDLEVLQQRQKVERYLGFSLVHDSRQNDAVKLLINEYRKKIHDLQSSKKQVQVKYKHLKHKYSNLISQNNQAKIERLEKLTQKQQMEIAKLIQTYDRQINFMFKENKKLKQGLYSLSYRFQQKSIDLEQKEKQLSYLKFSTQKVSFENQSLKKLNHSLIQAKASNFGRDLGYSKKDFEQQSFTMLQKRQSEQRAEEAKKKNSGETDQSHHIPYFSSQPNNKFNPKTSLAGCQNEGASMKYPKSSQSDFRFIQSVNIINGYNVNLGENVHHFKK